MPGQKLELGLAWLYRIPAPGENGGLLDTENDATWKRRDMDSGPYELMYHVTGFLKGPNYPRPGILSSRLYLNKHSSPQGAIRSFSKAVSQIASVVLSPVPGSDSWLEIP